MLRRRLDDYKFELEVAGGPQSAKTKENAQVNYDAAESDQLEEGMMSDAP
jgi:hypothetical protein